MPDKRISISLPTDVLDLLDNSSNYYSQTRSGYIRDAVLIKVNLEMILHRDNITEDAVNELG